MRTIEIELILMDYEVNEMIQKCIDYQWEYLKKDSSTLLIKVPENKVYRLFYIGYTVLNKKYYGQ